MDNKIENNTKIIEKLLNLGDYIQSNDKNKEIINCTNLNFKYGISIVKSKRISGDYKLFASNGYVEKINTTNTNKPSVIFGCRGTIGNVFYSYDNCLVLNTAMYLECNNFNLANYYFAIREQNGFKSIATGAVQLQITINEIAKQNILYSNNKNLSIILDYINNIEIENSKLLELKKLYLKKFFD